MVMNNPPHPGRSIRENCLEPLGLNVTEAAKVLGVARHTLSRVLNGRAAISPEMAIRLGEGGLVQCRVLDAPTDHLGSRPSAQGRRPDQRRAIPAGVLPREHQAVEWAEIWTGLRSLEETIGAQPDQSGL